MDELQRLVTVQSEEDANIAVADGESDIDCLFHSDFKLLDLIPPTNYKEAISFARKFWTILTQSEKTAKGPVGAPCLVTLYTRLWCYQMRKVRQLCKTKSATPWYPDMSSSLKNIANWKENLMAYSMTLWLRSLTPLKNIAIISTVPCFAYWRGEGACKRVRY